jgi:hypothetical protein
MTQSSTCPGSLVANVSMPLKALFAHVYVPRTQPAHEEFPRLDGGATIRLFDARDLRGFSPPARERAASRLLAGTSHAVLASRVNFLT